MIFNEKAAAMYLTGNSARIVMSQAANMCPLPILCLKDSACTMHRSDRNTKSLESLCGAHYTFGSVQTLRGDQTGAPLSASLLLIHKHNFEVLFMTKI